MPLPERSRVFCHQCLWELVFPCSLYSCALRNSRMFLDYWPMSFQSLSLCIRDTTTSALLTWVFYFYELWICFSPRSFLDFLAWARSRSLFLISRFIVVETQGRVCLVLDILDGMLFSINMWIPSLKNEQLLFTVISLRPTFLAKNLSDMGHSVSNQPIFRKCNMTHPSQMFPKKLLNIPQCVLMTQTQF